LSFCIVPQRWTDPAERERLLWAARAIQCEPSLLGLSPQPPRGTEAMIRPAMGRNRPKIPCTGVDEVVASR